MGAKCGEQAARNLWWPKLCEEWHCCPMACRARWVRGQTISSLQRRPVKGPWMMKSSILSLRWIYADLRHYWPASTAINLPNSVSNEVFSEPKTDASPAIVESNSEAGESSVKEIMDHCCLVQGPWHGCSSQLESWEFWLHAAFFGPNEIHAT